MWNLSILEPSWGDFSIFREKGTIPSIHHFQWQQSGWGLCLIESGPNTIKSMNVCNRLGWKRWEALWRLQEVQQKAHFHYGVLGITHIKRTRSKHWLLPKVIFKPVLIISLHGEGIIGRMKNTLFFCEICGSILERRSHDPEADCT